MITLSVNSRVPLQVRVENRIFYFTVKSYNYEYSISGKDTTLHTVAQAKIAELKLYSSFIVPSYPTISLVSNH
jgi:hypothetical protein